MGYRRQSTSHSATSSIASCSACLPFSSSSRRAPSFSTSSAPSCRFRNLSGLTCLHCVVPIFDIDPPYGALDIYCLLLKHSAVSVRYRRCRSMTDCKPGQKMEIQADRENARQPWEQHSHPFTRHIDVSSIRSHIVHLDRAGCSTSLLMRPGQLFRRHALPCLLFYGRKNVNPSSVSLDATFFGSWPRLERISP